MHIEGSKIFLPVFSKNYADSKWCLREIAKMVEINKREGGERPIIPVFYHVDPSDVKDPKSSFGEALKKLQRDEGLSEEQINEWRTALTEAGKISGFSLSQANGNEAKLITLIGKDVSNILCKVPFHIQPIGIRPYIDTLKRMLGRIPESIGNLEHLKRLSLKHCQSLEELPECIGRLLSLETLKLSGCILLGRIPESIGNLERLKCLSLKLCQSLEELPECIGRLLSLKKLNLSGCILLGRIPESIGNLKSLNFLTLSGCRSLEELPEGIGRLLSLEQLDLSGCTSIKSIPESIGDLENLQHLGIASELSDFIGMFTPLQELHVSSCSPLNYQSLKKLCESMEGLIFLRMLSICGGTSVNKLPDFMLCGLTLYANLVLSELEEIPELIGEFRIWEAIVIEDCPKLESLPQLSCPLTYLGILGCAAFRKLSDPSTLDCLKTLVLQGCKAFTDLSGLESLISLRKLSLIDRDGLSRDLMDKLSQASFKHLEALVICGARDGSDLLFGLPKSNVGQVQGLKGMYCLTEKLPSDTSDINIRIQVLVEGKIATEVTCIQTREEDQDDDDTEDGNDKELEKWVLGDQDIYEIYAEEGKTIVKWVGEGNTMLRIPTTYNHYRLRMALLEVAYVDLPEKLPMWKALLSDKNRSHNR